MAKRSPSILLGFVGRAAELANLEVIVSAGAQIVTLVGPPGVGKTRLARCFAAVAPGEHAFVDLTLAETAEALVEVVAAKLDVPLAPRSGGADLEAQVGRALAGRGALLVLLDNFDQLVDSAEIVRRWADVAPEASFLVTSRERLRVAGEHAIAVEPLALPGADDEDPARIAAADAVKLLRSRTPRPDAPLDRDAAKALAGIARSLEGLPLALELCAARLEIAGPDETLELLARRLDLLVARGRGAPARQATLRAAIDASWERLAPRERDALAACSVFRGGFDLDAAVAVLAPEPEAPSADLWTLDVLEALSDKSLLRIEDDRDGVGRRYALYETLRAYAAEKLASDVSTRRHAAHFAAAGRSWARQADGPTATRALAWIQRERDNLLAARDTELARAGDPAALARAVEAVLALEPVFATRGPIGRFLSLLDDTLGRPGTAALEPGLLARARLSRGTMRAYTGRSRVAAADCAVALAAAERAGDVRTAAAAEIRLALASALDGDAAATEAGFARAEARLRSDDVLLRASFFRQRGTYYARIGRVEAAMAEYRRAIPLLREVGAARELALAIGSLACRHLERGDLRVARELFEEAIALLRALGDRRVEGLYLGHLGCIDQELGRFEAAEQRFREALQIQRQVGDAPFEGWALGYLGGLALELGDGMVAAQRYGEAAELLRRSGDARVAGMMIAMRGAALALDQAPVEAASCFDEATALFAQAGTAEDRAALEILRAFEGLARAESSAPEDPDAAAELVASARAIADAYAGRGPQGDDVRFAHRLLVARLRAPTGPRPETRAKMAALEIAADGRWFARGPEHRVDLTRRGALSRILARLAAAHRADPNRALTLGEVFEAGWPGERTVADAAATRVYNAVQRLRKLGLERLLVTRDDGYLLDPAARVEVAGESIGSR